MQLCTGVVLHQQLHQTHGVPAVQGGGGDGGHAVGRQLVAGGFKLLERGGDLDAVLLKDRLAIPHGDDIIAVGIAEQLAVVAAEVQGGAGEMAVPAVGCGVVGQVVAQVVVHIVPADGAAVGAPAGGHGVRGRCHLQGILQAVGALEAGHHLNVIMRGVELGHSLLLHSHSIAGKPDGDLHLLVLPVRGGRLLTAGCQ